MLKADNLPPSCAVVTESGNLNFLEPSGPLRACNGTALPFTYQLRMNSVESSYYEHRATGVTSRGSNRGGAKILLTYFLHGAKSLTS